MRYHIRRLWSCRLTTVRTNTIVLPAFLTVTTSASVGFLEILPLKPPIYNRFCDVTVPHMRHPCRTL